MKVFTGNRTQLSKNNGRFTNVKFMNLAGKRNFQCDSAVTRYNDVYINYGNDNVRHKKLIAETGISVLDALDEAEILIYAR